MHSTNYIATLITPAPDCPAKYGTAPPKAGTIAALQYRLLAEAPYAMTSDDLLWAVRCARTAGDAADAVARAAFFAVPMACLRASPLVKTYGWGLHHDAAGRVALVGAETAAFSHLQNDPALTQRPGMRSARA